MLTDESIPVDAIRTVRIAEEQRRWYLKQRRTLPKVVVEYDENGRRREYPIRLTLHGDDTERELRSVVRLFEKEGVEVRNERAS